jgi:DNA-directed RNA polymerase subunit M/transcription elongation factor TFIIS
MSKYRTLILGLTKNKELKGTLVSGILSPAKFVRMKEIELASDDFVKELKEKEAHQNASKRSDAVLEYQLENGADSAMFTCINEDCGSNKVQLKQLQTRGADEPMTNFYQCLSCSK